MVELARVALVEPGALLGLVLLPLGLRVKLRLVAFEDPLEVGVAEVPLALAQHNTLGLFGRLLAVLNALPKLPQLLVR